MCVQSIQHQCRILLWTAKRILGNFTRKLFTQKTSLAIYQLLKQLGLKVWRYRGAYGFPSSWKSPRPSELQSAIPNFNTGLLKRAFAGRWKWVRGRAVERYSHLSDIFVLSAQTRALPGNWTLAHLGLLLSMYWKRGSYSVNWATRWHWD